MTTTVRVTHDGGNHPVIVRVKTSGVVFKEVSLTKKGDNFETAVFQGQTLEIVEALDES